MKYYLTLLVIIALLFFGCTDSEMDIRIDSVSSLSADIRINLDQAGYYPFYYVNIDSDYTVDSSNSSVFLLSRSSDDSRFSVKILNPANRMFFPDTAGEYILAFFHYSQNTGPCCIVRNIDSSVDNEYENIVYPEHDSSHLATAFLTLDSPDSVTCISGRPDRTSMSGNANINELYSYLDFTFISFDKPGYYQFDVTGQLHSPETYNVFVSPVPSFHTERLDRDWYYTQFRTVTTSNCGPTVVSTAIAWATGEDVPVYRVRELVGWTGSGAVNMQQMQGILAMHDVSSEIVEYTGKDQIFDYLAQDKLVGISYDMAGITYQPHPSDNFFDQYYVDHGGHYLALKGFSKDRKYYIIYDPIPSDWAENAERYADGVSMYGRNRYYAADELVRSFTRNQILVVSR